ncbi:hypothetical protein [Methylocystis echinoides]|jgi:hypothetical protein|uniref:hypothetical protein n=1 Tax=Methylocystis echinoides TaxID=29468 RepID=UPI00343A02CA
MNPLTQLDQLRRQMAEELTQIPQYRALKATERFIADLSAIYEGPSEAHAPRSDEPNRKIAQAIENHLKGEASAASIVKNGSYLPVHRVA